jgi:hypothetical protein
MLRDAYPYFLANKAVQANADLEVTDKYTGKVATRVAQADAQTILAAIDAAVRSQAALRNFRPTSARRCWSTASSASSERFDELAIRALHRGGQADQGLARRSLAADRHLPGRRRGVGAHRRRGAGPGDLGARTGYRGFTGSACRSARAR